MATTIKEILANGGTARVLLVGPIPSPKIIEIASLVGGIDGVFIDQEHSAVPHQQLELLMLACRASDLDGFVRLAGSDYSTVMRPMETGASGVMIAQVRTVEQVEQAAAWAKYPPAGERGAFRGNYEARFGTVDPGEHIERANRQRWLSIQIETPEAVECVEQIAAVEHVDTLFVGPSDLSITLGVPGQPMHPKCVAALERVSAAVKAVGKSWGVLPANPEHAAKCKQLGCQLYVVGTDVELIRNGLNAMNDRFKGVI